MRTGPTSSRPRSRAPLRGLRLPAPGCAQPLTFFLTSPMSEPPRHEVWGPCRPLRSSFSVASPTTCPYVRCSLFPVVALYVSLTGLHAVRGRGLTGFVTEPCRCLLGSAGRAEDRDSTRAWVRGGGARRSVADSQPPVLWRSRRPGRQPHEGAMGLNFHRPADPAHAGTRLVSARVGTWRRHTEGAPWAGRSLPGSKAFPLRAIQV